jgi:hypothetical protein
LKFQTGSDFNLPTQQWFGFFRFQNLCMRLDRQYRERQYITQKDSLGCHDSSLRTQENNTEVKLLLGAQNKLTILYRNRIKIADFGQIIMEL